MQKNKKNYFFINCILLLISLGVNIIILSLNIQATSKGWYDKVEELSALQQEVSTLKDKLAEYEARLARYQVNTLVLYTVDDNTLMGTESTRLEVAQSLTLEEQVQELATQIGKEYFNGLPLEVIGIEQIDGKRIARINLKEDISAEKQWVTYYFQGSTNGAVTKQILQLTLLQPTYENDWIDGVVFYYEGEPMKVYDHIDLSEPIFRNISELQAYLQ